MKNLIYILLIFSLSSFGQGSFVSTSTLNSKVESNSGKYTQTDSDNIILETLSVSITTGISKNTENLVSIYPNPTTDYLKFSDEVMNVTITNSVGVIVVKVIGRTKFLNVTELSSGIYFIMINKEYQLKMIKK